MKLLTALRLHKPGVNNAELMEYLQSVYLNPVQFHNDIQELLDLHKKEVEEVVSKEFIEGAGKEIYVRLEPLELSGEWLIRLGFLQSKSSNICYDILDDNGFISIFSIEHWTNSPDVSLHFWYCKHMIKIAKLQYVHQVQNIFHSLSLCELEIKIPLTN